jgi:hypothetical protein
VTSHGAPLSGNDDVLGTLLRLPNAVFAALASAGVMVPMPA